MVNVEWFYSKFDELLLQLEFIALGVTAYFLTVLIKALIYRAANYKKFGGSLLVSVIATFLTGTSLFTLFFFSYRFTDNLLVFIGIIFGTIYFIELFIAIIFKGKNSVWDAIIGSILGNSMLLMFIIIGIIVGNYFI